MSEVFKSDCKGLILILVVLFGFMFFIVIMFAGGKIGIVFSLIELIVVIVVGNLLFGVYVLVLVYIVCKSGLNFVFMGCFCFGEYGSKLFDLIFGLI